VLFIYESRIFIVIIPMIIDVVGYLLMTLPYIFWDYDAKKQKDVMEVLKRRAEVTAKNAEEQGEKVHATFIG